MDALCRPRHATTVHALSGGLHSFAGGAVGTSGGQRASTQPSGTSVIILLALVVVGGGWRLVGPRLVGPAIGGIVGVAAVMAKIGGQALKLVCGLEGRRVRDGRSTGPLRGGEVAQELLYDCAAGDARAGENNGGAQRENARLITCSTGRRM